MIKSEQLSKVKKIKEILYNNTLYQAIIEFENTFATLDEYPQKHEYENIKSTFNYMLEYFAKDSPDPQRETIYEQIKKDLFSIADELGEYIKAYQVTDYQNIYSYYHQKIDLLLLLDNLKNDASNFETIFKRIWLTNKFNSEIKSAFIKIIDEEIDEGYKSSLVSAMTLSLIRFFDDTKFEILFDVYHKQKGECSLRALVGVIIGMLVHQKRIMLYPKIVSRFGLTEEVRNNDTNIELVIYQLIKSKETEGIIKEFEEDILPEMMKMQGEIKNIDLDDFTTENLMDDENPGWENFFDKNPDFLERMENFTKRQFDGSDIFSATLGNLKNFDFFRKTSNWFLPFNPDNQEIRQKLNIALEPDVVEKFLTTFEKASYFCNSDKYSFCLHINDIAAPMRNTAVQMLISEIDSAEEMLKEDNFVDELRQNRDIVIRYIQDLYRFFNFNKNIKGFKNIFKIDLSLYKSKALNYFSNKDQILRSSAELYFSKKFYEEASQAFEKCIEFGVNEADVYEKLAFSYQKTKNFEKALDYYKKAELFDQNKMWLFKKIAYSSLKIENYELALEYYKKVEIDNPEDTTVQTFIGRCYMEMGGYENALKYFFKADFYKPNNVKTMRNIAFCSFKLNKIEQAKKYANKCIEINGEKFDFMLLGNINWIENNKQEAVLYYKTALNEFKSFDEFRNDFYANKEFLFQNNISEIDFNLMLDFLEMKYYQI